MGSGGGAVTSKYIYSYIALRNLCFLLILNTKVHLLKLGCIISDEV